MKKSLLSLAAIVAAFAAEAQCDQLFISEYVVGTGNNKAYELYNPTDQEINLNGWVLERWSNGEGASTDETTLMGTIPAYGTWVVANGQTEDIDLGTFISPACDPELQALADQLDNPYPAPTFMNGDDALVLVYNGSTVADIFGKPGEDPGDGWSTEDGTIITSGHTMIRKPSITGGVTTPPDSFEPLAEWDTLGTDDWSNLGTHTCDCNDVTSVGDREDLDVQIYPTIVTGDQQITVKTNYAIREVEAYDATGKLVKTTLNLTNSNNGSVVLGSVPSGVYIVNIIMEGNVGFSTRIIKE